MLIFESQSDFKIQKKNDRYRQMSSYNAIRKVLAALLIAVGTTALAETGQAISGQTERLASLFNTLKTSENDSTNKHTNDEITDALYELLTQSDSSFYAPFDELPYMGKCYSSDGELRIYTWNYPLSDKTYGYGGLIQFKPKKNNKKTDKPLRLKMGKEAFIPKPGERIAHNKWYGALYYKAIKAKKDGQDYYILFGWSGNDALSDFKTVETLKIAQNRKTATLGGTNAFVGKGRPTNRIVLQYNNNAKVALDYDEEGKRIVMDHLVPSDPFYKDIYSYYGPDFSYDAYIYDKKAKGLWRLKEDIDQRNK